MKKTVFSFVALLALLLIATAAFANAANPNPRPTPQFEPEYHNIWTKPHEVSPNNYKFFMDNNARVNMLKHLWFYMEFTLPGFDSKAPNITFNILTVPPSMQVNANITWKLLDANSGLWSLERNDWLSPQPEWEMVEVIGPLPSPPAANLNVSFAELASVCRIYPGPDVPEPASMLLLASGLVGLVGFKRHKKD